MGNRKKDFPIELLQQFQNELKKEFDINEDEIIKKRWEAILEYFRGNIENSLKIYQELLKKIKSGEQIESYFKDDILIDGRNINIQYNNQYKNEFQEEIDKSKHILANPIYDRIKTNIYEEAHKNSFGYKNKSKYTFMCSNTVENICNEIQILIYVTIFYGSITYIKFSRELLSDILYIYADVLRNEELYLSSLRMLLLSNNTKEFEQLFNVLKCKTPRVHSNEFISSLLKQRSTVIKFYIDDYNCFLYKLFGKYLSDEEYLEIENTILSRIKINDKKNNNIFNNLKALKNNILRINNKEKLFQIFLDYFNNGYSGLYKEIVGIINLVEVELLNKSEQELFENILDKIIIERKKYDLNIIKAVENYKKVIESNKYDEIVLEDAHNIIFSSNNNYEIAEKIINIMEEKVNQSVISIVDNECTFTRDFFKKDHYTEELDNLILTRYIPVAISILHSSKQTIYKKKKHIKILANLLIENNEKKYKNIILGMIDKINLESIDDKFEKRTDLIINKKMLEFLLGIVSQEELINTFNKDIIDNEENILEILKCLDFISEKIELEDANLEKQLYFMFIYVYSRDFDIDVKCESYVILKMLLKTKYRTDMIKKMKNNASICTFEEANEIVKILPKNIEDQYIKEIKEELLKNNDYNIRKITNNI